MKVEINNSLSLTNEQERFVNFHSLFNVLSVIDSTISYIMIKYDVKKVLSPSKAICNELIQSLNELSAKRNSIRSFNKKKKLIIENINEAIRLYPELKENDKQFALYIENLESIFNVLSIRVKEAIQILENPKLWVFQTKKEILNNLGQFLEAVEKNSLGKYKIAYNKPREKDEDYQVNFRIKSYDSKSFAIPILLNDIIRDTVANSRKYSKNGNIINVLLSVEKDEITYSIEDCGIGIAPEEIEKVIELGKRGRNVGNVRSFGNGAGLTKVALATNYLSGKLWIDSTLGIGTKIILKIPTLQKNEH